MVFQSSALGTNPVRMLDRYEEPIRERFLNDDELKRLWEKLDELDAADKGAIYLTAAIRIALLTGMRKGEIMSLTWSQVDLTAGSIKLMVHKTSRRFGHRLVGLSEQAVAILEALPRKPGVSRVFCGKRPDCGVNLEDGWNQVREAVDIKDVHFHDLRHTFGTIAGENGAPLAHIGGALGQTSTRATQRYTHQVSGTTKTTVDGVGKAIARKTRAR